MMLPTLLCILSAPAVLVCADRMVVGLTQTTTAIQAVSIPATAADPPTVLIIGGLNGQTNELAARELNQYAASEKRPYRLLAINLANPNRAQLVFPPAGRAYKDNPESHYLWRWIGVQAPDLVLVTSQE